MLSTTSGMKFQALIIRYKTKVKEYNFCSCKVFNCRGMLKSFFEIYMNDKVIS